MKIYSVKLESPLGKLFLLSTDKQIIWLSTPGIDPNKGVEYSKKYLGSIELIVNNPPPVLTNALAELKRYFSGEKINFKGPFLLFGTDFQKAVWKEISKIPYGQTVTYSQLAKRVGAENAVRAIGTTCGKNPILILIPCHRILGRNGKLTGYAGGLKLKEFLLNLEGDIKKTAQLNLV